MPNKETNKKSSSIRMIMLLKKIPIPKNWTSGKHEEFIEPVKRAHKQAWREIPVFWFIALVLWIVFREYQMTLSVLFATFGSIFTILSINFSSKKIIEMSAFALDYNPNIAEGAIRTMYFSSIGLFYLAFSIIIYFVG